jgi:hypothetical protein
MQKRFLDFSPTHFDHGSNSSHTVFLLLLSYQLRLHECSTSEQYSPSTSAMPLGQAPGEAACFDGVVGFAFDVGAASGIDELAEGGFAAFAPLDRPAGGAARPCVAFGFAPAQAAASTMTDKANVSARRTSGP